MKLYEFEGHKVFKKAGLSSPLFVVVSNLEEVEQAKKRIGFQMVAKVQVLAGKRGKNGGVKVCKDAKELADFCEKFLEKEFLGEQIRFIQLSQLVDIEEENYLSITYDTVLKIPFLMFSKQGGMDIEKVDKKEIVRVDINPFDGPDEKELRKAFSFSSNGSEKSKESSSHLHSNNIDNLVDFAMRLWDAFSKYDCRLVEVNPMALVKTNSSAHLRGVQRNTQVHLGGESGYMAIDAKVILDDAGLSRHKDLDVLQKGAAGAIPTARELKAREIDENDYRGTAGSRFIEFDGDIAVLASGGGASLLVMDALFENGGLPANYTEYSGNPPREKVEKLTKIALSRQGLAGCLVAGAVANFTDIFETLSGFVDGLVQVKPKPNYPIVIRRGGPSLKEAYEMIAEFAKKEGYDIHLFGPETPISVAAKKMVELSKEYKSKNPKYEVENLSSRT